MEKKQAKLICNKSGGTASKGGVTYRATLPTTWIKEMGLGLEERDLELEFNEEEKFIKITKK